MFNFRSMVKAFLLYLSILLNFIILYKVIASVSMSKNLEILKPYNSMCKQIEELKT